MTDKTNGAANVRLAKGNYLLLTVGWGDTFIVPATEKTLAAFNLLFNSDTLQVDTTYDANGTLYRIPEGGSRVSCEIKSSVALQKLFRPYVEREEVKEEEAA